MAVKAAKVDQKAFMAWVNKNPLRVWRQAHDISIMQTAATLGVSMTLVQLWERGVHVPSRVNMSKLRDVLGPKVQEEWRAWFNARPIAFRRPA